MIGHIFITSMVQSDQGVFNMSGVGPEIIRLLSGNRRPNGMLPAMYGDGIFSPRPCLVSRYLDPDSREERVNIRFAPLRVYIEHTFRDFHGFFRYFRDNFRMKLLFDGLMVCKIIIVAFFVLNCYYCCYNTSSRNFGLSSPTLEQYLPLDEVLPEYEEEAEEAEGGEEGVGGDDNMEETEEADVRIPRHGRRR